jgi:hypothetical protein
MKGTLSKIATTIKQKSHDVGTSIKQKSQNLGTKIIDTTKGIGKSAIEKTSEFIGIKKPNYQPNHELIEIRKNKKISEEEEIRDEEYTKIKRQLEKQQQLNKENSNLKYILKKFNNDKNKDNSIQLLYKLLNNIFDSKLSLNSKNKFNTYLKELNIKDSDNLEIILYKQEQKKKIIIIAKAIYFLKMKKNTKKEQNIIKYFDNIDIKKKRLMNEINIDEQKLLKKFDNQIENNTKNIYSDPKQLENYLINTLRNYNLSDKFKEELKNKLVKHLEKEIIRNPNKKVSFSNSITELLEIIYKLKLKESYNDKLQNKKIIIEKKKLNNSKNKLYSSIAQYSISPELQEGLRNFSTIEYYMYNEKFTGNIGINDLNELCPYFYVNGIFNINPNITNIFNENKEIYKTGLKDENFRAMAQKDGIIITDEKPNNNNKILDMGKIIENINDFNYAGSYLSNIFEQKILSIPDENKSKIKKENIEKYINQEYFDIWCQEFNNIDTLCVVKDGRILHKYVKSSNDKIQKLTSNNRIIFTKELFEKKNYHSGGGLGEIIPVITLCCVVGLGWFGKKKLDEIQQNVDITSKKVGVLGDGLNKIKEIVVNTAYTVETTREFANYIGETVERIDNRQQIQGNTIRSSLISKSKNSNEFNSNNNNEYGNALNEETVVSGINSIKPSTKTILRFKNIKDEYGHKSKIKNIKKKQGNKSIRQELNDQETVQQHVFSRINNSPKWTNAFAIKNIFLLIILLAAFHYPVIILGLVGYNIYLYGTYFGVI